MRMTSPETRAITVFALFLLVGIPFTWMIGLSACNRTVDVGADQIRAWRDEFPAFSLSPEELNESGESRATLDMILKTTANAYVVAKVMEHLPEKTYSAEPAPGSSLSGILSKPGQSSLEVTCEEMDVEILDIVYQGDAGARLNEDLRLENGQIITVSTVKRYAEYFPELAVGTKVMMPLIIRGRTAPGYDYSYACEGLYYIVRNRYVLSGFESRSGDFSDYDGLTVEAFSAVLIQMRNTPSKWVISPYD